jgi:hypothetical protein
MNQQLGGVQNVFRGPIYQQGYGGSLGGTFSRFFRWIVPIAQKHIIPYLKSGLQSVGKEVVNTASSFADNAIKNLSKSATDNLTKLKEKAQTALKGGKRLKKKAKSNIIFKKRKKSDIFG